MIVAIGFDHAGYLLRGRLLPLIKAGGHEVLDFGTDSPDPIDYPDKALEVGQAVASGRADRGILVCGSGAGVSVADRTMAGATGATTRSSHAAIMSSNSSISPNSRAADHRPRSAIEGISATYTPSTAERDLLRRVHPIVRTGMSRPAAS